MNIFGKTRVPLFLIVGVLTACKSFLSTPTLSQADRIETAMLTATSTAVALPTVSFEATTPGTSTALPTFSFVTTPGLPATPFATLGPTSTPQVFTDPSIPLSERIVYYRAVAPGENPIQEGSVLAVHLFAPTYADETYTSDTAADLRTALEAVLRGWTSTMEILEVKFGNGHANVVLQGEYPVAGDAQLVAASWQILLTVFANPSVQTATVTRNGDTIWNWGVARAEDARPEDYVYTRVEIETYMKEHAYRSP